MPFSPDNHQIIGNDAPSDPPCEAIFAMIKTAIQAMFAFEDTFAPETRLA